VAEPVVDMLFPKGSAGTIPIIAITGTNGKTTTTRLTAHISKTAGYKVGYTTSDGVYIQNQ
jgi:cyanophycin synthetase